MIMLPLFLLFISGGIALIISLHFFQHAVALRRRGASFTRKAGYGFIALLSSVALFLGALFYVAHLVRGVTLG